MVSRGEVIEGLRDWTPRVATWLLVAATVAFGAWVYLANPQPGPYGQCYASRGRPMPCELVKD